MRPATVFAALVAAAAVAFLLATMGLAPPSRLAPLWVAVPTLALAVVELARARAASVHGPAPALPAGRVRRLIGWGAALLGLIWALGFLVAVPLFLAPYLRAEASVSWRRSLVLTALATAAFALVFGVLMGAPFPPGRMIG